MSKTVHLPKLTEAAIKREAEGSARDLRDYRHPPLMLRFRPCRTRASWMIVHYVGSKTQSRKFGNWPDLQASDAIALYPKKLAELIGDSSAAVDPSDWQRLGDLLSWYADRNARDRTQSEKRRSNVRSMIARHLLPRLGSLRLDRVDHAALDDRLMMPMQESNSPSYVRQAFQLLKVAFRKAHKQKRIKANPLADVTFTDFIDAEIKPKGTALREQNIPAVIDQIRAEWSVRTQRGAMLAIMMLCHGTRISETRMAKWANIDLEAGEWFIPARDTKTGQDHRLPITRQVKALLTHYRSLQKSAGYTGAFLFPNESGQSLSEGQGQTIFDRLGAGEWTSHDLRKVARSMWADLGVDYLIGELLLNHALDDLDEAYIHTHAATLKRDALQRWHTWLETRGLFFAQPLQNPDGLQA